MSDSSTFIISTGMPTVETSLPVVSNRRKAVAGIRPTMQSHQDDFAAVKSGLDGVRSQFYAAGGRTPNTKADATRRQRSLTGGPGDRQMTQLDLWVEREVSRHLRDHSSIYNGIIETWAAETVQSGFRLKPATGDSDLNILLKELLFGWDGDGGWFGDCDARGLGHFWDIITQSEEVELQDGDHAFYLNPKGNNGRGSVAIIEGCRILTPYGYKLQPGYIISNGIVWNDAGYAVAVFIADVSPQNAFCSVENGRFHPIFRPWRAKEGGVVLSMMPKRPTSTRRLPWLSTAVRAHDEIDDVFVAVRIALRNEACRSTYTKIDDWDAYKDWMTIVAPDAETVSPVEGLTHSPNPGDHNYLNPGEDNAVLASNTPGNNFDPFMNLQLTTLGLPIGMCLEESVRIFQRSFAASRMAVNGTRSRYERRQRQIKRRKVTPLLQFGIACHQTIGLLPDDKRCERILCGFPGWPYMEPLKDAQASKTLVESKLRSRRTCATEIGDDYDAEIPLMQEEEQMWPTQGTSGPTANTFIDGGNQ